MLRLLFAALAVCAVAVGGSAAAESRFFLFVTHDVPSQSLIDAAVREAQTAGPPVAPEVSRERLGRVFPELFDTPAGEPRTIVAELQAGSTAHYATSFEQAEVHFARAFELAYARPELLDGRAELVVKLADGAALRYANATAANREVAEARRLLREFVRRFPSAEPTRTDHPPVVFTLWEQLRTEVLASAGQLMVNVQPLELDRSGSCRLLLNGAEVGRMPLAGPLPVPAGPQQLQVICGLQRSWLQRVEVRKEPLTVRVPIRAMLASRAEVRSGGLVLTAPEEGDASALVEAMCEAASFEGAVVIQSAVRRALIGRWERGATAPSIDYMGQLGADGISDVHKYTTGETSGRVATWVVGGFGLAALLAGGGTNLAYISERDQASPDAETLHSFETASAVLYATGAALLVTSVVLYFVEGDDPVVGAAVSARPGLVQVRF